MMRGAVHDFFFLPWRERRLEVGATGGFRRTAPIEVTSGAYMLRSLRALLCTVVLSKFGSARAGAHLTHDLPVSPRDTPSGLNVCRPTTTEPGRGRGSRRVLVLDREVRGGRL